MSTPQVLLLVAAVVCTVRCETLGSSFAYSVSDPTTGDHKDQQEIRAGDAVSGYYRTLDPDGLMRTVNYRADPLNGFNAEVDRSPAAAAVAAGPVAPIIAGRAALPYAAGIHPSSRVVAPLAAVPALAGGILPATAAAPIISARSALSPLAAMPALTAAGIVPATTAGIAAPIVAAADGLARSSMSHVQYHPQRTFLAAPAAAAAVVSPMAATNWNMWNQPAAVLPAAGINTLPLDWAARAIRK